MRPRKLNLPDLIDTLVSEHGEVKNLLRDLSVLIAENRFSEVGDRLKDFRSYLDQHVIDEEASVLKTLLDAYGREGSARAIVVFQEHREIHQLIKKLQEVVMLSRDEPAKVRDALDSLMTRHFEAEESWIFPWVLETYRRKII